VKIDVEGSEVAAIQGMADLLSRSDGPVLLYESNAHALPRFGQTPASRQAVLQRFGYSSYIVEPGQLIPTLADELRPECVVNCLAVKDQPPTLAGWPITAPRSLDDTILKIVSESRSPRAHDRAYLARILAEANVTILSDPRVRHVLRLLYNDADEAVRAGAAWFRSPDSRAALGPPRLP